MTDAAPPPPNRTARLLFHRAPAIAAAVAFFAGALSLVTSATPGPAPMALGWFTRALAEAPNLAAAAAGVALMALSIGLNRRVRIAWLCAVLLAAHGAVVSAWFKSHWVEALVYAGLIGFLLAARKAFFRRSALSASRLGRLWLLSALAAGLLAAVGAALWAGHRQGFVEADFWALVVDPDLGRAGRPVLLGVGLILFLAFMSAVASAAPRRPPPPGPAELTRAADILAKADAPRPDAVLALSGDKSFVFTPDGAAFVMYAASGGALVSMGGPVGARSAWPAALDAFKAEAERQAMRPVIYAAPPELLPCVLDLGFKVEKIGENAVLDLADFSLSGRKREVIRRGRRKLAEREGATFEMRLPPHSEELLERLKPVSDAWLAEHGGREKAFSLGRFDKAFLDACPLGVVEIHGRPAAFGTLWTTPDKGWAAIDLMRYDPDASPTNTMDFLLVELILWAKSAGYERFDLAMAPLSGLADESEAPLFERLGRMIYERGERFYNFQGLRRFKQKFDPRWEPRYIASPGAWSLPVALAQAALLTNGGPLKPSADRNPLPTP